MDVHYEVFHCITVICIKINYTVSLLLFCTYIFKGHWRWWSGMGKCHSLCLSLCQDSPAAVAVCGTLQTHLEVPSAAGAASGAH